MDTAIIYGQHVAQLTNDTEMRRHSPVKGKPYVARFERILQQQLYDVHDVEATGEAGKAWPVGQYPHEQNMNRDQTRREEYKTRKIPKPETVEFTDPTLGSHVDVFA